MGRAPSWSSCQGIEEHWNDCRAECERCGEEDDIGFILALVDDLATRFDIDPDRIYAVGESNGGFMAQRLAQEATERFAAVGAAIALAPGNNDCAPSDDPIAIMYQVGTEDSLAPYEGGSTDEQIVVLSADETVAYWVALNQCTAEPESTSYEDLDADDSSTASRDDYDCSATGTALSLITLEGAGHVAPSIEIQVSGIWEGLAGIQNHDIEGAREFWAFFEGHSRTR
jgi:polyhydroxybutyrate depolymerase